MAQHDTACRVLEAVSTSVGALVCIYSHPEATKADLLTRHEQKIGSQMNDTYSQHLPPTQVQRSPGSLQRKPSSSSSSYSASSSSNPSSFHSTSSKHFPVHDNAFVHLALLNPAWRQRDVDTLPFSLHLDKGNSSPGAPSFLPFSSGECAWCEALVEDFTPKCISVSEIISNSHEFKVDVPVLRQGKALMTTLKDCDVCCADESTSREEEARHSKKGDHIPMECTGGHTLHAFMPKSTATSATNILSWSLLRPFFILLGKCFPGRGEDAPFSGPDRDKICASLAGSFFKFLQHMQRSQLCLSPYPSTSIPKKLPDLKFPLWKWCVKLLLDDAAEVRKVSCKSLAALLVGPTEAPLQSTLLLLYPWDAKVQDPTMTASQKALAKGDSMGSSVDHFLIALKQESRVMDVENLLPLPREKLISIIQAIGSLATYPKISNQAQSIILWNLLDKMRFKSPMVRAAAYDEMRRIQICSGMNMKSLLERHKKTLFLCILEEAAKTPELTSVVCEGLLESPPSVFIQEAMNDALPQLIFDKRRSLIKKIAKQYSLDLWSLILMRLQDVLALILMGHESRDGVLDVAAFLLQLMQEEKNDDIAMEMSLEQLIDLCGPSLVERLVWHSADGEKSQQVAASRALWDLLEFTSPTERGHARISRSQLEMSQNQDRDPVKMANYIYNLFLRTFDEMNKLIKGSPDSEKRKQALKCIEKLIELIGHRLNSFVAKLLPTFKLALSDITLRMTACSVIKTFLQTLEVRYVGVYLGEIVIMLLPYIADGSESSTLPPTRSYSTSSSSLSLKASSTLSKKEEAKIKKKSSRLLVQLLQYLLVKNRKELSPYFQELPRLPTLPELQAIERVVESELGVRDWKVQCKQLVLGIRHESPVIRAKALDELKVLLLTHEDKLLEENLSGSFGELMSDLVSNLLTCCSDTSFSNRLKCSEVIGVLGALDPGHLQVTCREETKRPSYHEQHESLIIDIITTRLVAALRSANSSQKQDRTLYTIQELLKLLKCNEDTVEAVKADRQRRRSSPRRHSRGSTSRNATTDSMKRSKLSDEQLEGFRNWDKFSKEVQDVIFPCLTSKYAATNFDATETSTRPQTKAFFPTCNNYQKWASAWCGFMCNRSQGPRAPIFRSLRMVLKTDFNTTLYILPYLVDETLRYGEDSDVQQVRNEVMAVLSDEEEESYSSRSVSPLQRPSSSAVGFPSSRSASDYKMSSSSSLPLNGADFTYNTGGSKAREKGKKHFYTILSRQIIFELLDVLNYWLGREQVLLRRTGGAFNQDFQLDTSQPAQSSLQSRQKVMESIPLDVLARAALGCKANFRAVKYFEGYLRQVQQKWRAQQMNQAAGVSKHRAQAKAIDRRRSYLGSEDNSTPSSPNPQGVLGAGLRKEDLSFFQKVYMGLDEPDALLGIAALRHHDPSLDERLRDLVSAGNWSDALTAYEQALDVGVDALDLHVGVVNCLKQLGHLRTALTHVQGVFATLPTTSHPKSMDLANCGVQAAWRLADWKLLDTFLQPHKSASVSLSKALPNFEVYLSSILSACHQRDHVLFEKELLDARKAVMYNIPAASRESYQRAYPFFVQLHMLQDVESIKNRLAASPHAAEKEKKTLVEKIKDAWQLRLCRTQPSFRVRERILSLRRVLASMYGSQKEVAEAWLCLAQEARAAKQFEAANRALLQAAKIDMTSTIIEEAKLLHTRGQRREAVMSLERELEKLTSKDDDRFSVEQKRQKQRKAQIHMLMGQWIEESGSKKSEVVIGHFKDAMFLSPEWDQPHYCMGQFYDKLLHAPQEAKVETGHHPHRSGSSSSRTPQRNKNKYLLEILQSYGNSLLTGGHRYLFQALPRLLTLYLDAAEDWQKRKQKSAKDSGSSSTSSRYSSTSRKDDLFVSCIKHMDSLAAKIAPYQWLTVLPQIVSRFCHPSPEIFAFIKAVIRTVFLYYPQQALWIVAAVTKSIDRTRSGKAKKIMAEVHKAVDGEAKHLIKQGMSLFDNLIKVCNHPVSKSTRRLSMAAKFRTLSRMDCSALIVPIQHALTITLPAESHLDPDDLESLGFNDAPARGTRAGGGGGGGVVSGGNSALSTLSSYNPFPDDLPKINGFHDEIEILKSKEKPRKLYMNGSDGKTYLFLCKKEERGDMRKNSRMMELNTVINRLLKSNPESRQRQLRLRTFAVLPLTEECGVIEWVPNTTGLRHVIDECNKTIGLKQNFKAIKKTFATTDFTREKEAIKMLRELIQTYPPCLNRWFLYQFPDPTQWYHNREGFARSCAAWSMVGYLVGLGDRHCENILLDEGNGEAVHVDFDCLFDKGKTLEVPERVPFRLTSNVVDGFGITGIEGVFRRSCEITLGVLRSNRETLMSVLHTFIHDPLVEWRQREGDMSYSQTQDPAYVLKIIENRLKGLIGTESLSLSVEGQVHQLLEEATSEYNLARMYIGIVISECVYFYLDFCPPFVSLFSLTRGKERTSMRFQKTCFFFFLLFFFST